MKVCKDCGASKPLTDFHRHSRTRDGRNTYCRVCVRARRQQWYLENREASSERSREYYAANSESINARVRARYLENPEPVREYARAYRRKNWRRIYAEHGEAYRARSRRYYRENSERWVGYAALRRGAVGPFVPEVAAFVEVLKRDPCAYCGSTDNIEIDHVVPLSRGGQHVPENLAPACRSCNRSKGAKLLSEWCGPQEMVV